MTTKEGRGLYEATPAARTPLCTRRSDARCADATAQTLVLLLPRRRVRGQGHPKLSMSRELDAVLWGPGQEWPDLKRRPGTWNPAKRPSGVTPRTVKV